MKKLFYTAMFAFLGATGLNAQNAFVQVIHACADAQADSVDVYMNDGLTLNNFAHRTATGYLQLAADTYQIKIATKNSISSEDAIYTSPNYVLESGKYYTITAAGLISSTEVPFQLFVSESRNTSLTQGNTDVLVFHGSPDAPAVDVTTAKGVATLVDDFAYGTYSSYLQLPNNNYSIEVRNAAGTAVVAAYEAPLLALGLNNLGITVIADGYLSPSSGQKAFGLFAVLPSGGEFVALPVSKAKVQIIHNSPNAGSVDIYLNKGLALNDVAFRTATGFIEVNAGVTNSIAIAAGNSSTVEDALVTYDLVFDANQNYLAVAAGLLNGSGQTAFNLVAYPTARLKATDTLNTDVIVFHGSTDAPTVDVTAGGGSPQLINNLAYGTFGSGYLSLPNADYSVEVRTEAGDVVVKSYEAPLKSLKLKGAAITVLASGYLSPANNEPAFGLYAVTSEGGAFLALPVSKAKVQIVHNSTNADSVDVYLNGKKLLDNFAFRTATAFTEVDAATVQTIAIAPKGSSSASSAVATYNLTFAANTSYVAIASGIVGATGDTAFNLYSYAQARETARLNNKTDVLIFHGSTNAPVVDVTVSGGTPVLADNLAYGKFNTAGYLELDPLNYVIDIRNAQGDVVVASYQAPLQTLNLTGAALTVIASGYLNATSSQPAFGLFAVPATEGNLIALPASTTSSIKSDNKAVQMAVSPVPAQTELTINSSEIINQVQVYSLDGRMVKSIAADAKTMALDIRDLNKGTYVLSVQTSNGTKAVKVVVQ